MEVVSIGVRWFVPENSFWGRVRWVLMMNFPGWNNLGLLCLVSFRGISSLYRMDDLIEETGGNQQRNQRQNKEQDGTNWQWQNRAQDASDPPPDHAAIFSIRCAHQRVPAKDR